MNIHKLFNAGFNQFREESGEGGDTGGQGGEKSIPMSEVQKLIDQETQGLKGKVDELLTEAKLAKQKAREAEEAQRKIAEQKAQESGDIEALQKSWAEKEKKMLETITGYQQKESDFAIKGAASKIASSIATGANAELLAAFVEKRLRYQDGETKVVDESGNLTVSSLEDLQREFSSNPKYASLINGTGSRGSGANPSNTNGGAGQKTITRAQFDEMSQLDRGKFFQSGGKVVEN